MIGRAREESFVEDLLAAARAGRSGAVLVSGDPGIGKTALLAHARTAAGGARLLEATGSEAESRLAFAGLADLLGPILDRMDELPAPQAEALRGALALGPPQPGDRFTAYAATLSLLAAAAEERPVVCLVDDAHWLDAESLEAIQFAAARLGTEGITLILAARDDASALIESSPLSRLRLSGLGDQDAERLLRERSSENLDTSTAAVLVAGAAGNPLALIELATALTPRQLGGREPLPDPLPVGPHLSRGLLGPVDVLAAPTRRALLIASVDDRTLPHLAAALAADGLSMDDLAAAEEAGVVTIGPERLSFSHPLVRAAVYQGAQAPDRRAAHRAHAAGAEAAGDSTSDDRRAWHLALAATGPDEEVASALERAGGRAAARTAYAAGAEALEAAARLSPDPVDRGRRLIAAGQNSVAAGSFARAARALDDAVSLAADPAQLATAIPARCFVEIWGGSSRRAIAMLVAAADRAEESAPPAAAFLLAQAITPCHMRADLRLARELSERAGALAARGAPPEVSVYVEAATTITRICSGFGGSVPAETEAALTAAAASGDPLAYVWAVVLGYARMYAEDYEGAARALGDFVEAARDRNTPSVLPLSLSASAEVLCRQGRLTEALGAATEAVELARDTRQPNRGFALCVLARVEAVLGRERECRAHAAECLEAIDVSEAESLRIYANAALGLLALGLGDLEAALTRLVEARRVALPATPFSPLLVPWPQDLVETRIRLGDFEAAQRDLAELEETAQMSPAPSPRASVARCRGLMADDDAFEDHLAEALALHAMTPTPFERARTELCLGERRRRARRMIDAREPLATALRTFESMGAAPWVRRTRHELRAAGGSVGDAPLQSLGALTPQELRVALSVAAGATNREAATSLLISPKTVESHLARVYAKLDVRSRAELAARLARAGTGA